MDGGPSRRRRAAQFARRCGMVFREATNADCPTCNKQFVLSKTQRRRRRAGLAIYCSRRCAAAVNRRRQHDNPLKCKQCHAPFTGHHLMRYCGNECKAVSQEQQRLAEFTCEECYGRFTRRRSNKPRFCSPSCAGFYNNRQRTGRLRKVGPLVFKVDPMEHIGLVFTISRRFIPYRPRRYGDVPLEETDQFQDGCIGLLYACARFDATKGVRFSTWAWPYIRGYILRGRSDWRRAEAAVIYLESVFARR